MIVAHLAAAAPRAASVKDLGDVVATLNDWRSILLYSYAFSGALLLIVLTMLVVIIKLALGKSANDVATLAALQANTKAQTELAGSVRALEMIASRREAEGS